MEIDDELEPLTVYSYEVSSPPLDVLIRHVLKTIPDSYADEFPSFSVFEAHSAWDAHVDEENIICDSRLLDMPRAIAIGTLAHEFAHLFLRHPVAGGLQDEDDADELARQWGFTQEVRAMRQEYGPPTEERKQT